MDNLRRPSGGVTAAGVITIVFSSLALLGVLFGVAGLLMAQRMPRQVAMPGFALAGAGATMMVFLGVAVWGIAAGIGLLRLRNWARISAIVWAGLSVPFSALVILVFAVVPIPAPPNQPAGAMLFVRGAMLLFYGIPLAIGVCWLILFTRQNVADQFTAPTPNASSAEALQGPVVPARPSVPLPIIVVAWFMVISALSVAGVALMRMPALLFGVAIRGSAGTAVYLLWGLAFAAGGIGLLQRKRWGYSLSVGLHIFGILNTVVALLSPNYDVLLRETMSSMNLPPGYPSPALEHMRAYASIGVLGPAIILALLVHYRARYLEATAPVEGPPSASSS